MQVRSLVLTTQLNRRNALIIMTVMILIALTMILAAAAFVQNDELSEDYDDYEFSIFPNWGMILPTAPFPLTLFTPILCVGVLCAADLGGGILAPP